jgi:hypothetical protein
MNLAPRLVAVPSPLNLTLAQLQPVPWHPLKAL